MSEIGFFNLNHGFMEAVVRGYRSLLLSPDDYRKLSLAETLEDLRSALEDTDYGSFLQDESTPLSTTTVLIKLREKFVNEFKYLRSQAQAPLDKFLDFISIEKMIDNVINLIQGATNKKSIEDLISRVNPIGWLAEMRAVAALDISEGNQDLYRTILVDTPVGPYFEQYFDSLEQPSLGHVSDVDQILTEQDLEIMRNVLKKYWLEDFYEFCLSLGGTTSDVMCHILQVMADFRVLSVTLNSINRNLGTSSQMGDRNSLYPSFGYLYPEGIDKMRRAYNDSTLRSALELYPKYLSIYEQCRAFYVRSDDVGLEEGGKEGVKGDGVKDDTSTPIKTSLLGLKSLEDFLFFEEVKMGEMAFEQQFHFGLFYAWTILKEQEIRNVIWIADMILMKRKEHVDAIVPIFLSRN